jgi:CubicO group peptidase (beta-lactamase class C family)
MSTYDTALPRTAALIEQGIKDNLHLGAQLYVSLESAVVADEAIGEERPDHPMTSNIILPWMSSVKPLTAVLIARLMEQKALRYDAPVATYIPEFGRHGKERITLRHLLTHTAGLRNADAEWTDETWEDAIQRICALAPEPDWTPGEKAGYHLDGSWYVLGEIIQRVTDRPYADVVQEDIFEALKIDDAWIGMPADAQEQHASRLGMIFAQKQGQMAPHSFANTSIALERPQPARNGRGPIHALGRFYEDMLAGWSRDESMLLTQETVRTMTSPQRGALYDETFRHTMDWGLGFMVNNNTHGADTVPYSFGKRASPSVFGHGGAQSSVGMADPEHGLVVAIIMNGMPGEPRHQRRIRALMTALYEDLAL